MATQRKFRRGTTAQHATFTGALAEATVDTDKLTLVVHDGSTPGGFPLLPANKVVDDDTFESATASNVPSAESVKAYADKKQLKAESLDALKAFPSNNGAAVLFEEGREGYFVWDDSDLSDAVAADTSEGVYVPGEDDSTGVSGAWVRRSPEFLTPGFFGVPHGDGAGDHTQVFADIEAALAEGYGHRKLVIDRDVRLPAGWQLNVSDVAIEGVNNATMYVDNWTDAPSTRAIIWGNGVSNVRIRGVRFEGEDDATRSTATHAVLLRNSDRVIVDGCVMTKTLTGVWVQDSRRVWVGRNTLVDTLADGIHFGVGSESCWAVYNDISGGGDDGVGAAQSDAYTANTDRVKNIFIIGNRIDGTNNTWGAGVGLYGVEGAKVALNRITNTKGAGIHVLNFPDVVRSQNVLIESNHISNPGNTQYASDGVSAAPHSTSCGIYARHVDVVTIRNNTIDGVANSPNTGRAGIGLYDADVIMVKDNIIRDVDGAGIIGDDDLGNFVIDNNTIIDATGIPIDLTTLAPNMSGKCAVTNTFAIGTGGASLVAIGSTWAADSELSLYSNKDAGGKNVSVTPTANLTLRMDGNSLAAGTGVFDAKDDANASSLYFSRYSSSPAASDLLHQLNFRGRNNNSEWADYGWIRAMIDNVTDGAEAGRVQIGGMKAGSAAAYLTLTPNLLDAHNPIRLPTYTVATVPSAATFARCAIWVSDESGGATLAVSNGTNWLRLKDGATIS